MESTTKKLWFPQEALDAIDYFEQSGRLVWCIILTRELKTYSVCGTKQVIVFFLENLMESYRKQIAEQQRFNWRNTLRIDSTKILLVTSGVRPMCVRIDTPVMADSSWKKREFNLWNFVDKVNEVNLTTRDKWLIQFQDDYGIENVTCMSPTQRTQEELWRIIAPELI